MAGGVTGHRQVASAWTAAALRGSDLARPRCRPEAVIADKVYSHPPTRRAMLRPLRQTVGGLVLLIGDGVRASWYRRGLPRAFEHGEVAHALARSIADTSAQMAALAAVASSATDAGQDERAAEVLDALVTLTQEATFSRLGSDQSMHSSALVSITQAIANTGAFEQALSFAHSGKTAGPRCEALAAVAESMGEAGLLDQARSVIVTTLQIEGWVISFQALVSIDFDLALDLLTAHGTLLRGTRNNLADPVGAEE
ncbi:hypothetical protein ILP97_00880 [Amycolatopsis sp. H6(2020)]|nr:hypothetical protein [Amycolatopsis sp. H6(2020)]